MANGRNVPRKIIVHHTADASLAPQFEKVNAYHRAKWNLKSVTGSFVGYHWFIERDGSVYQARAEEEEGAHCLGHNRGSIGIGLAGDFSVDLPTASQRLSMVKIIDQAVKIWQIHPAAIFPHRAFRPTSCYGLRLSDRWARQEYDAYLHATLSHLLTILKAVLEQLLNYVSRKA